MAGVDISLIDNGLKYHQIDIVNINGTIINTVSTNGTIHLNDSAYYTFVLRPEHLDYLSNPFLFLSFIKDYIPVIVLLVSFLALFRWYTK